MVLEQDTESAEGEALLLAAQMHPTAFAAVTKRGYLPADFHFKIGDALLDVAEGRCDRLILTMPPRHGKSELVSVRFPAWYLGRYPDRRIIAASYGIDLAEDFGRKAKNVINESAYRAIFPHVALARDSSAASRWNLDGYDGGYIAAGVGGPITGRGAHLLLIDDPVKNREEADSQTIRESIWNWFTSTAFTRQESPFACIIIMTRWHEHDLVGRLLEESEAGGDRWRIVNFPAIDDDGLPLWPEKYDIDALQRIRRVVGTRDWSALYQQSPSPVEGGLLKRHWWRYWAAPDRAGSLTPRRFKLEDGREVVQHTVARPELAEFDELIQSWDLAFKDTKDSSFVVGQVWGRKGPDRYLLSQIRGKWDYNATLKRIRAYSKAWPEAQGKLIEDKANGPAVIASLRSVIPGIIPVPVRADKEGRVNAVLPVVEAGNVYIPHPAQASWVDDFIDECAKFPNTTYKDQVDAMTQALARWQGRVAMDTIDRAAARRVRQRYRGFSIPRW